MQQEPQDSERPRFTVIHHGVMLQLAISANEYLILDTIYHLSAKHGYCYKSTTAMAVDLGLTDRGVRKVITRLIERGMLNRSAAGLVCGSAYTDVAYLETAPRYKVPRSEQSSASKRKKVPEQRNKVRAAEQSTSKKYSIEEQENNNILVQAKPARPNVATLKDLFYKINTALQGADSVKATDGRLRKLKARLSQFSAKELMIAAECLGADDYMQGDSEQNASGKRYGTIDYFVRSDESVAKWLEAASVATQTRKTADWLNAK